MSGDAETRGGREPVIRRAHLRELDPVTLYRIAKLRQDVFTIAQKAEDPDLDGLDLDPGTTMLWIEAAAEPDETGAPGAGPRVLAHARVLCPDDGTVRIGRVVVDPAGRGRGLGVAVVREGIELARQLRPDGDVLIDAQAYLEGWYAALGFVTTGELFLEAGIPHLPMRYRHRDG